VSHEPLTPLYVRIPQAHAKQLDSLANARGQSKQHLVSEILAVGLADSRTPAGAGATGAGATGAGATPAGTSTDGSDGTGTSSTTAGTEVLTTAQVATLLGVTVEAVEEAVRTAGLPGRMIGGDWRFAKAAVLAWLALPDPSIKSRPGYKQSVKP
jgi:excisionase family DNA binding protein